MREDLDALADRLLDADGCRVFGYCRVSSSKQEQGLSLQSQEEAIRQYCKKNKLGEPIIVTETSSSGKRMFQLPRLGGLLQPPVDEEPDAGPSRPRLLLLLGHLTALKKAHLVVWRLDRFARLNDEREVLYQLLTRNDVTLHTTDRSEQTWLDHGDPNDPMTALMRQVFGAFSQYEKAVIEIRMQTGMRFKAAQGGYTGGRPPFGYESANGELKVNPEQAIIVRYVFMLSKRFGMSLRGIDDHFALHERPRLGKNRLHRILKHESLYRGAYKDRFGNLHRRPDLIILTDDGDYDYIEDVSHGKPE
jgi:DNA invertase Pin-like site-specific DNA recombinase